MVLMGFQDYWVKLAAVDEDVEAAEAELRDWLRLQSLLGIRQEERIRRGIATLSHQMLAAEREERQ